MYPSRYTNLENFDQLLELTATHASLDTLMGQTVGRGFNSG
ncbi:MAG: hypothetical protein U0K19_02365 [Bifidobacteriaceae bacterium]|nr:hypothetical protein [Bifidobacteriaceae bacterium]